MGRVKHIKNPQEMWDHFQGYIAEAKSKPIKVKDWVGGMAKEVTREKEVPLTIEGFENYCENSGLITDLGHYFANSDERYNDFIQVCARIKRVIRQDQIEGGMAGIYNPNITQRLNNLVEKTENKHEVSEIIIKREG